MDPNDIKKLWSEIKPEWNEVKSTDWKAYFSGWMPKWKPWLFCFILFLGISGITGSLFGYEKTSDWAKQNGAETCSSAKRVQGNYDYGAQAASLFCEEATLVDRFFKGIFSITLLGGCLMMYHGRKRELLGDLTDDSEANTAATPENDTSPTTDSAEESSGEPEA
jgi:hypothetical protein